MHVNEMFTLIDDCQVSKNKVIKLVWWQWIKMEWEICDITGYILIKLVVLLLNIFLNHLHMCVYVHVLYIYCVYAHMCQLWKNLSGYLVDSFNVLINSVILFKKQLNYHWSWERTCYVHMHQHKTLMTWMTLTRWCYKWIICTNNFSVHLFYYTASLYDFRCIQCGYDSEWWQWILSDSQEKQKVTGWNGHLIRFTRVEKQGVWFIL
jgi:hypothetical protein